MKTAKGNRYGVGNEIWRDRNGESQMEETKRIEARNANLFHYNNPPLTLGSKTPCLSHLQPRIKPIFKP